MDRFKADYNQTVNLHCLKVFGVPETDGDGTGETRAFGLDSYPRVAEIFLRHMDDVSWILIIKLYFIER